ncbi:MAG: hypothetical protein NUV51_11030 [Sulfuricaulis sp.]|nr:hypothetical protein [Sulfuricaulis sp.]
MSVVKEEQHKLEVATFQMRNEGGVQSLRALLYMRRDQINKIWPGQEGEALVRLQGAAQEVAALIKMIDIGPSIKPVDGN